MSVCIFINMRTDIKKEDFIKVCQESLTMAQAAVKLNLHFNTFKRYAIKFNCYLTNQSGKGLKKPIPVKVSTEDILSGKFPEFQTFKLKNRLLDEKIFINECSICKISEWNNKPLNMELDHIDGNRSNHKLQNLRLLCPNCHAQTDTYRSKNRGNASVAK